MHQSARLTIHLLALLACILASGCSSTVKVRNRSVVQAPPVGVTKAVVLVNKARNNDQGEATALENGLLREFRNAGYEASSGGLMVSAEITEIERGSTVANVLIGMGAGSDHADVSVLVDDATGKRLMSFVVRGKVVDKRYRELGGVLAEYVPQAILREIREASR